jgi:hypothetical protein
MAQVVIHNDKLEKKVGGDIFNMKTIVKRAEWEDTQSIFDKTITIVTIVLEQDGIYFDPSYEDFLGYIFRKFAKERMKSDSLDMKLDKKDIFFFHENANSYMLNMIYIELFGNDSEKNFDTTNMMKKMDISTYLLFYIKII